MGTDELSMTISDNMRDEGTYKLYRKEKNGMERNVIIIL
jgi:hypothetical protein